MPQPSGGTPLRQYVLKERLTAHSVIECVFRTRGSQTVTIGGVEFVRRLVRHVLPDRFHKIRHVGLNASKARRALAEQLLGSSVCSKTAHTWQTAAPRHDWPRYHRMPSLQRAGQPAASKHSPTIFAGQPAASKRSPTIFAGQPAASKHSPTIFAGQPAASKRSPTIFAGQPAAPPTSGLLDLQRSYPRVLLGGSPKAQL
jgi:hypothetical protein